MSVFKKQLILISRQNSALSPYFGQFKPKWRHLDYFLKIIFNFLLKVLLLLKLRYAAKFVIGFTYQPQRATR